jgi:hypothetical protein
MVTEWLERSLGAPMSEMVQQEHRRQVVQQTSLSNVITSCRRLAQIQWQDLFEAVSRLDVELANDPVAIYSRVDFETRNRYRDAVEQIARWSKAIRDADRRPTPWRSRVPRRRGHEARRILPRR